MPANDNDLEAMRRIDALFTARRFFWRPTLMSAPVKAEPVNWLPWTPFCLSSGDSGGVDFLATLRDEREDFSREVTLQRSNGVEFGMAF
jgi:hypothetical protein